MGQHSTLFSQKSMLCLYQDTHQVELLLRTRHGNERSFIPCNPLRLASTLSVQLIPAIQELTEKSGIKISQIEAISCINGPGSFTGLRITLAALQGIAIARTIPIYTASLLKLIAFKSAQVEKIEHRNERFLVSTDNGKGAYFSQTFSQNTQGIPLPCDEIHITEHIGHTRNINVDDLYALTLAEGDFGDISRLHASYGVTPVFRIKNTPT